jgi:hypothetical protein
MQKVVRWWVFDASVRHNRYWWKDLLTAKLPIRSTLHSQGGGLHPKHGGLSLPGCIAFLDGFD